MHDSPPRPDLTLAAAALDQFLRALGLDADGNRELLGTGARVAELFARELCAGEGVELRELLRPHVLPLAEGAAAPALLRLHKARVTTTCPHHLLPAEGEASLMIAPNRRLIGLGALTQLVRTAGRRLVLQETLGEDLAEALFQALEPRWVLVRLRLRHGCMRLRGEGDAEAEVETWSSRGELPSGAMESWTQ